MEVADWGGDRGWGGGVIVSAKWVSWVLEGRTDGCQREIAKQVEKLPPTMQERVLRYVATLSASTVTGVGGTALRQFSGSIDAVSAREMMQAIEEECERVDAGEW